jgi:hypothetical protein
MGEPRGHVCGERHLTLAADRGAACERGEGGEPELSGRYGVGWERREHGKNMLTTALRRHGDDCVANGGARLEPRRTTFRAWRNRQSPYSG